MLKYTMVLIIFAGIASAQATSTIPKVLVLGDSISLGYTPVIQKNLESRFSVTHGCGAGETKRCNNGFAALIVARLPQFFAKGDSDIVTFNTGIHDMSVSVRGLKDGLPCAQKSRITPIDKYRSDLNTIFDYLTKHSKIVIWIDTTTLPSYMCAAASLKEYNTAAEQVAQEHGAYILHTISVDHDAAGIHFTSLGYEKIGTQISDCIITAWTKRSTDDCKRL